MTITNAQILALSTEAAAAGDMEQVAICIRALAGEWALSLPPLAGRD